MFDLLLESRPRGRARPWSGGAVALAAHAAIIFSIVRVAQQRAPLPIAAPVDTTMFTFHDPEPRHTVGGPLPTLPLPDFSRQIVPVESLPKIETALDLGAHVTLSTDPAGSGAVDIAFGTGDDVIAESLADERPELLAAPPPRYPDLLRTAGIEGRVVVRAIVDTLGRAELASIQAVSAGHPAFQAAAVECIRQARFRPARVRGRAVRVLVEIPVDFRIRR